MSLKVKNLLDIDKARIKKSKAYKVIHEGTFYHLENPTNFFIKIWKKIFGKVLLKVHKFKVGDYTVILEISDKATKSSFLSSEIRVMCTCADFKYRCAYGLNKTDNIFLNDNVRKHLGIALTDKPKIPTTYSCKHVYAALQELDVNYAKYLKT